MRIAKEEARRAHAFREAYPTASNPNQEVAAAIQKIRKRQKQRKISLENFLPRAPIDIEPDQDLDLDPEDQVSVFTAEGHLNHSAAYTAELAQICNFDSTSHVPSMHF